MVFYSIEVSGYEGAGRHDTPKGFRCLSTNAGGVPDGITEPSRGMSQRYPNRDVSVYVPSLSPYFAVIPIPIPFLKFDLNLPEPVYHSKYIISTLRFS